MRFAVVLWLLLLPAGAIGGGDPQSNSDAGAHPPARLSIASGILYSATGAAIQLRSVNAEIQHGSCGGEQNKPGASCVSVENGAAVISDDSLSKLLNEKLAGRGLKEIKVSEDKGKVKITGKADKLLTMPFTVEGPVSLTKDGNIRLQTETVRVAKLPGLADLLGVDPEKMTGDNSIKGITADKNSITFDPNLLWGMSVNGKVTRLVLQHTGLVLMFGQPPAPAVKKATQRHRVNSPAHKSSHSKK